MTPRCVDIPGVDGGPAQLRSYSGVQQESAWVLYPDDEEQLRRIFRYAHENRRRLTFRAGGCSFDAQSLGDDIVVSMDRFDAIDVGEGTVTVGAGATWGRIVRTLEAYGYVPAVTVTTERATAGGTMSGNCLSRFSAAYGKEGKRVRGFTLMTPDGTVHDCRPPQGDAQSLSEQLFLAAIGGLGYLGAVLSITYEVLPVPRGAPPTVVKTEAVRVGDLTQFVSQLVDCVRAMDEEDSSPLEEGLSDAFYSAVSMRADGGTRALIFHSRILRGTRGAPLVVFSPRHPLRVPAELLFRVRAFNTLIWWLTFHVIHRRPRSWVNGLVDFTFFMDGNMRAKRFASRFKVQLKTLQQTLIIPSDFSSDAAAERSKRELERWLREAAQTFSDHGVRPTFQDVLWLPHDHRCPLSSTGTSGGFAVSYAFDSNGAARRGRAEETFAELSLKAARYHGRVYLVKNVYAKPMTLSEMYGNGADEFRKLKRRVDPDEVLTNRFFKEKLAR